jgi:CheY-like chemotaxis protein
MARILILDEDLEHANCLADALRGCRHAVTVCHKREILTAMRTGTSDFDIAIFDISHSRTADWKLLDRLRAISVDEGRPIILCVFRIYRGPGDRVAVEEKGLRLVYER